ALWRKSFGPAIAFAKLSQRRMLRLDNPFLDGISFDYRPYFYNPQTDRFGDYRGACRWRQRASQASAVRER
ncbi:MAG: hypothetical protein ACRC9G_17655, partial [Aeromonas veronii]